MTDLVGYDCEKSMKVKWVATKSNHTNTSTTACQIEMRNKYRHNQGKRWICLREFKIILFGVDVWGYKESFFWHTQTVEKYYWFQQVLFCVQNLKLSQLANNANNANNQINVIMDATNANNKRQMINQDKIWKFDW